jgi:YD repeat-containing protein
MIFEGSLYETFDFDDTNRLQSITDNANGVYSFAYDVVNRMTTRVMPNGISTTTDYDGMGRMKFWKNQASSGAVLNEYNFGYNNANQITSITEPSVRTRTFGYDNSDRLTSVSSTLPNQNENYSFDGVGNRTSSHLSSSYGYQQGAFNRLTATQTATYSFDANGNVTSKTDANAKWYYSYDRENRQTNAVKFGGMIPRAGENIVYQYDALGRRVVLKKIKGEFKKM